MAATQKIVIVGAGPVGSLAALYAAQRDYQVEVYELRPGASRKITSRLLPAKDILITSFLLLDLRDPDIVPLNFTKSINLAISERGINAMRHANTPGLLEYIMEATVPMRGRMIHGRDKNDQLHEHAQDYDVKGRVCVTPSCNTMPNEC